MIVGIDMWKPDDNDYFLDLGATWTHLQYTSFDEPDKRDELNDSYIPAAVEAGLTVAIDMRPSSDLHQRLLLLLARPDDEEMTACLKLIRDGAAEAVRRYGDIVHAWEFWGEYDTPTRNEFYPNSGAAYWAYLKAVHEGIKSVNADYTVWNGGYGVNFQPQFLQQLAEHAPSAFDEANWHHYNISEHYPMDDNGKRIFTATLQERVEYTSEKYREMFTETRKLMDNYGCKQPFVSSEWGLPVVDDSLMNEMRAAGLYSTTFKDDVYGIFGCEAVEFLNAWMAVFEECGIGLLMFHRLHDSVISDIDKLSQHWGNACGLMYADGTKKAVYEALRPWIAKGAEDNTPTAAMEVSDGRPAG